MKTFNEWLNESVDSIKNINGALIEIKKGVNEKNYQKIVWEIINIVKNDPKLKKYMDGDAVDIPLKTLQEIGVLLGPEAANKLNIYKPKIVTDSSFKFKNDIVSVEIY